MQQRNTGKSPRKSSRDEKFSKRRLILINASMPGETRVAITEGSQLANLSVEREDIPEYRNSIFKGRISALKEELSAAFVAIGLEKDGFLPLREAGGKEDGKAGKSGGAGKANGAAQAKEQLQPGDELLVQLVHEQPGTGKGPMLRRNISLPGRLLVLSPGGETFRRFVSHISPSRQPMVTKVLNELKVPDDCGVLLRMRAAKAPAKAIQQELDALWEQWRQVKEQAEVCTAPRLMMLDGDLVTRTMRNYLTQAIDKVVTDSEASYEALRRLIGNQWPEYLDKLELYSDSVPLFHKYQIDQPVEALSSRKLPLHSRGEIVIDRTEAMTTVDVNTKRFEQKESPEEVIRITNLEAVREVARQLVLRDIGGLVVIDFIDMDSEDDRREVESEMDAALKKDPAHVERTDISKLGLMELTRQRMAVELMRLSSVPCRHCSGNGWIMDDYSYALSALREAQDKAIKRNAGALQLEVPSRIASLLSNELRSAVHSLEQQTGCYLTIVANPYREGLFHSLRFRAKKDTDGREDSREIEVRPDRQQDNQKRIKRRRIVKPVLPLTETQTPDKSKPRAAKASVVEASAAEAPAAEADSAGRGLFGFLLGWLSPRRADAGRKEEAAAEPRAEQATEAVVGGVYHGKVVRVKKSNAFVNILPGKSGQVRISDIAHEYVNDVRDYLSEGQEVDVKVLGINREGRIRLSIKALIANEAGSAGGKEADTEGPAKKPGRRRGNRNFSHSQAGAGGRGGRSGGDRANSKSAGQSGDGGERANSKPAGQSGDGGGERASSKPAGQSGD